MAINDTNEQQQQQPRQPKPQPQGNPYGQAQQQQQTQVHAGFGRLNQIFQRSGAVDQNDTRSIEALRGLKEVEREVLESQGLKDDVELIRFDRNTQHVGLSSILVVKTVRLGSNMAAVVRTLMLESDTVRLKPRVEQVGNMRIEVPVRPQDVFNNVYWSRIEKFLRTQRGLPELMVYNAEALVIPAEFDFNDTAAVTRLLITSNNRCDDLIAHLQGEEPLNISKVKAPEDRLTARLDFTGQPTTNIVGNPIRADILISMNRNTAGEQQSEDDYYDRETEFNEVAGFINLEYAPEQTQQPQGAWGQPQGPQPLFTPTFVITQVRQANWIAAQTPELYLLALSNAFRVTAGTQWVKAFLPVVGAKTKGPDIRDVGALGYMTPAGQRVDTKTDTFTDQDFVDFMAALVRPKPVFLIDVDPVGDHAGVENYFIEAAMGGPNSARAAQKLVQAANNLTGNRFSEYFNAAETPVVVPYGQEVHLGYYIDDNGEKRDIRDLDVLAMLNLTQGNITDFMNWYQTLCDTSMSAAQRLQKRELIEREYLGKNLKITGRATRLLLTPQFIEALDAATRAAGLYVEFEDMTSIMAGQRFVGNTLVNQYMVSNTARMGYGATTQTQASPVYGGVATSGRLY